jgi:hypothetical protein
MFVGLEVRASLAEHVHVRGVRASLVESVKMQIEKLEFSLTKMCLQVAKRILDNHHLLHQK